MFDANVCNQISCYVYRLVDPRNGETFYVGRGQRDRAFQHARAELAATEDEDALSLKLQRIRAIRTVGHETLVVIHRHGMSENAAAEVEAALIDAYAGLTNVQGGYGSADRGPMSPEQIVRLYDAEPFTVRDDDNLMLIKVKAEMIGEHGERDAVRLAWKVSPERAKEADFVRRITDGIVGGVYKSKRWLETTRANFPDVDRELVPGRHGFDYDAKDAGAANAWKHYGNKRVPDHLQWKRGAAYPVRYNYR